MAGSQTGHPCLASIWRGADTPSIVCFDRVRLYEPACEKLYFDARRLGTRQR